LGIKQETGVAWGNRILPGCAWSIKAPGHQRTPLPGAIMLFVRSHDSRALDGPPGPIMLFVRSHDSRALDGPPGPIMLRPKVDSVPGQPVPDRFFQVTVPKADQNDW
jgi:hypothetical protein